MWRWLGHKFQIYPARMLFDENYLSISFESVEILDFDSFVSKSCRLNKVQIEVLIFVEDLKLS